MLGGGQRVVVVGGDTGSGLLQNESFKPNQVGLNGKRGVKSTMPEEACQTVELCCISSRGINLLRMTTYCIAMHHTPYQTAYLGVHIRFALYLRAPAHLLVHSD